jgi:uncharacterized protein YqeY
MPEMRATITEDVKTAMKAGEKDKLSTLRMMQAAIKDRDIANRGTGKDAASDDELLQLFTKMVKQREESAAIYDTGGRPELAAKERQEIGFIHAYMPKQRCLDQGHGQGDGGTARQIFRADGFRQSERGDQVAADIE